MRYADCQEQRPRGSFRFPIEFHHVDGSHPRYQMPFHWHMDYELLRVMSGTFTLSLDEKTLHLHAGDVVLIQDGVLHGGTPADCVYECIDFDLTAFLQNSAVGTRQTDDILNHRVTLQSMFSADSAEAKLIHCLFDTLESPSAGVEFLTQGLIFELLGLLLQNHRYTETDARTVHSNRRICRLKNALRLIRERYDTPLTLEQLSSAAEMSPKYFCRFFAALTGRTPIDYLNYYRVECACTQLLYGDESVTEIALACGFNDLSYFVKTFKRYKGVTPKQFRKGAFSCTGKTCCGS